MLSRPSSGVPGRGSGAACFPIWPGSFPGSSISPSASSSSPPTCTPRELLRTINHALPLTQFFAAAANGSLPSFSLVDPDYGAFSEENPQDVQCGEGFAAKVIDAVCGARGGPRPLLIFWLYDGIEGDYDHVVPDTAPVPDGVAGTSLDERFPVLRKLPFLKAKLAELDVADAGPRTYDQFGFRVPAVIVSPSQGRNMRSPVPSTTPRILKLIEEKWNLPALTRRDAAAVAPLGALDLEAPPAFLIPPVLAGPAKPWTVTNE